MSVTQQEIQGIIDSAQTTADTYSQLAEQAASQAETVAQTIFTFTEPSVDVPSIDSPLDQVTPLLENLQAIVDSYLNSRADFVDVITAAEGLFDSSLTSLLDAADSIDVDHVDVTAGQVEGKLIETEAVIEQAKAEIAEALPILLTNTPQDPEDVLSQMIEGGLLGLSKQALDAQFNRARDRAHREMRRQEDSMASLVASRGFSLPPGAFAKQVERMQGETVGALSDINREQTIRENEIAIENARLISRLRLEAGQLVIQTQLQLFQAYQTGKISLTEFKLRAAQTIIAAKESAVQAVATFIDAKVRARLAPLEIDARIAQLQGEMERILSNYFQAFISAQRLTTDAQIANARIITDFAGLATRAGADAVQARVQAAVGAVNGFSEIAASALAALNTVASLSSETQEN